MCNRMMRLSPLVYTVPQIELRVVLFYTSSGVAVSVSFRF